MIKQDDIFLKNEGNRWYRRNAAAFDANRCDTDWPMYLLEQYSIKPKKVVEVGCSGGWRLNWLKQKYNCQCAGVDPSAEATEYGKGAYPGIDFVQGTAAKPNIQGSFDLVIINFVFHWVDREMLFASLSSVDSLVADNGFLIIGDFFPDFPSKNYYHHLPKENVFTYKLDYSQIFIASALYTKVAAITSNFNSKILLSTTPSDQRAVWTLLRKSNSEFYLETTGIAK